MMVDTLTIARELRAADLPAPQAEAIAAAIARSITESAATKADVAAAEQSLRSEINLLKAELQMVRQELKAEIERVRSQLLVWVVSTQVAVGGLIIAIIKL
ncbi:MAG: hypothetical protein PGN09_07135 [Sphingomonas fennica]